MSELPLMPKATAVWLIDNTTLTFEQIGEFCGMHSVEVQGIADGEVAVGILGEDPVASEQLAQDNLQEAEKDPAVKLVLLKTARQYLKTQKGAKYTPVAKRQDKPDAIAWFVKNHPYVPDSKIAKIIGTTKKTIEAIREKTHWNSQNIKPRDPVLLGICSQTHLDQLLDQFNPNT